ncbi:bifunctional DNA-formamidopyrimidine glycosylase/DNA-(apurinic or apyrimidinic site) lyase [Streptomyces bohaiensis]|uniref:Formamidopyrimidine-DNA glycosylase n=1 Tax=Streptomyces bohaiensis TaxID=1431344 RepID=A0ABX1C809_9ACTN|nr:bifunctional DNA-formamidopyrimidine glycosylase/DNA-(apurinic or apyrimidinic site) lyase [Streptomyces bohaiensis]NJQ15291.1 bifunctional DNA-formamidopyrimidine glycosylase/DNA-(apurinic or apyrimidinic site) lyase [Streptomyces bohaiensis]
MPELPEVEVVRRGLERWTTGRTVARAQVYHPRAVRRHEAGAENFAARLRGCRTLPPRRRGKYLWVPLLHGQDGPSHPADGDQPTTALLAHLGMSGQLLIQPAATPDEKHLRVRVVFDDEGAGELRFVDQRTFGGLSLHSTVVGDPEFLPAPIAHIARDPLDPLFDEERWLSEMRRRGTTVKRALLDQSLVSGVGNIYADEALWRARVHFERPTQSLARAEATALLGAARDVMNAALDAGGTSFDSLYVNVNGQSGYFSRSLDAYGREGEPCRRCGTPIVRRSWTNRSSYFCPVCQPAP